MTQKKTLLSNRILLLLAALIASLVIGWAPQVLAAAEVPSGGGGGSKNSAVECTRDNCDLVKKYLRPLIRLLSAAMGVIVVIGIIVGGIQYASSSGDPQKAAAAKQRIRNALVAFAAFLFLYAFLQFLLPGGVN